MPNPGYMPRKTRTRRGNYPPQPIQREPILSPIEALNTKVSILERQVEVLRDALQAIRGNLHTVADILEEDPVTDVGVFEGGSNV